jgi:hypothetical protein
MYKNDADYFNEEVLDSLEAEAITYLRANLNSAQINMKVVSKWSFKSFLKYRIRVYSPVLSRCEHQHKHITVERITSHLNTLEVTAGM